jgi:hypothetical protein
LKNKEKFHTACKVLTLQYGINLARKSTMEFEKETTTASKNYRKMPKIIFTNS